MPLTLYPPGVLSYGFAALIYLAFGLYLAGGARRAGRGRLLVGAVLISVPTFAAAAVWIATQHPAWWAGYRVLEAVRIGLWLLFLSSLLRADGEVRAGRQRTRDSAARLGTLALIIIGAVVPATAPIDMDSLVGAAAVVTAPASRMAYAALLAVTVIGLMAIEGLVRNGSEESRWRMKPLLIGTGGAFAFDLFMYADTVLFTQLDVSLWIARSLVQALVVPFVLLAAMRNKDWTLSIAVSRGVVFHSTALFGAGLYLLAIAAAGYYVQQFGGTWGKLLQTAFLFGALLLFSFLMLSGRMRAWLRVFISKNFYAYRFDYRKEWLRVTNLLAARGESSALNERVIRALADLVESPAGSLWLRRDRGGFFQATRWNSPRVEALEPGDSALVGFLTTRGWVIDLGEWRRKPDLYEHLALPAWLSGDDQGWLIVPLLSVDDLTGFIVLARPRTSVDVNWEVRDLLKSSGRQAASYLVQIQASEALLEAGKFDAFNRMSAFVVHDLKNLVAQLSLLLKNAERHKANPEFQEDMLLTIRHVTDRMTGLLAQLRAGTVPVANAGPVDLGVIVQRIQAARAKHSAPLQVDIDVRCVALGHEDRLERVIGHLVQNAQDATRNDAPVRVALRERDVFAVVEVSDQGIGMSTEFVRDKLFKPFQTTKTTGMGIGAYESAQYVAELGGRIEVESSEGEGTTMRVYLPLANAASAQPQLVKAVA